jgi:16S rRNA (uracil1498-N3)-methyltransferase
MSAHRFLVDSISGDAVTFSDEQSHQLRHVLRLHSGDTVRVFDGVAPTDLLVKLTDAGGLVIGECPQRAEPRTALTVYPALLRRDKFEPVLQKLTELGVAAIVPTLTAHGLIPEAPDARRLDRWRAIVREASEQCGRGRVPTLHAGVPFSQAISQADGTVLLAFEGEQRLDLQTALRGRPDSVSLLVGPEGGFSPEEVALARDRASVVTLGPRILRAETAAVVAAALVLYELGDLSSQQP